MDKIMMQLDKYNSDSDDEVIINLMLEQEDNVENIVELIMSYFINDGRCKRLIKKICEKSPIYHDEFILLSKKYDRLDFVVKKEVLPLPIESCYVGIATRAKFNNFWKSNNLSEMKQLLFEAELPRRKTIIESGDKYVEKNDLVSLYSKFSNIKFYDIKKNKLISNLNHVDTVKTIEDSQYQIEAKKFDVDVHFLLANIQCNFCGKRFLEENLSNYTNHIENHSRIIKADIDQKYLNRSLFPYIDSWFSFKPIENIKMHYEIFKNFEKIYCSSIVYCTICKEKIEMSWDDNKSKWRLRQATKASLLDEKFIHNSCL